MSLYLSYEPGSEFPRIPHDMARFAAEHDLRIVAMKVSPPAGLSGSVKTLLTLVEFLPSAGEFIRLPDGEECEVQRIIYRTGAVEGHPILYPLITAELIEEAWTRPEAEAATNTLKMNRPTAKLPQNAQPADA